MTAPACEVDILVEHEAWSELADAEELARRAVAEALGVAGKTATDRVEISLLLADDARLRALNQRWRGQDKATNVLSFPAPDQAGAGPRHLGDIALAYETLRREAIADGKTLADHFSHLVVHGTLHLLGYDHADAAEAGIMEAAETEVLAALGVADPYRDSEPF